eukprot:NODE_8113_length_1522_cov_5.878136.p3 GENE.NODE_8113_length_1522_cov_5.878136~~NODE_8113_length_1522_cov_5.878136.p3  ORF type:complete len:169 (-),score=55.02 NODE_8113_length_1522_cov_5.878136:70-576(-)
MGVRQSSMMRPSVDVCDSRGGASKNIVRPQVPGHQFNVADLTSLAWSWSRLKYTATPCRKAIAAAALRRLAEANGGVALADFLPWVFVSMAWAMATLREPHSPWMKSIATAAMPTRSEKKKKKKKKKKKPGVKNTIKKKQKQKKKKKKKKTKTEKKKNKIQQRSETYT